MKTPALFLSALLGLLLPLLSCSQTEPVLSGQIQMSPAWESTLYLVRPDHYGKIAASYVGTVVDSAVVDENGRFIFSKNEWLEKEGMYFLMLPEKRSRFKRAIAGPPHRENYIPLVLSPEAHTAVEGQADALTFSYKVIKGNASTLQMATLRDARMPLYEEFSTLPLDSLIQYGIHGNAETQKAVNKALDAMLDTLTDPWALYLGLRWRVPDNEFRYRPEFYLSLLEERLPADHPFTKGLAQHLQRDKLPLLVGEQMPEFTVPDVQGKNIGLGDLKGELMLVDFWASWCAPCRKEMRETIRPLYDKYHQKGFEVLGISIDADKVAWTKAMERDGAIWPNACDLLGDNTPLRESLRFRYIPFNYVLDKEGNLLARNLHGEELEHFVEEYFDR